MSEKRGGPGFGDDETVPEGSEHLSPGAGTRLLVFGPDAVQSLAAPERGSIVIGRSSGADVSLQDPALSREHAVIRFEPATLNSTGLFVKDLGSANGTRLRGERLPPEIETPFAPGDLIDAGRSSLVVQRALNLESAPRRLLRHGYFELRLEEECERAKRASGTFAVVRVSVPGTVGPEVVEASLSRLLGPSDLVSLYAPGQYDLLLADADPGQLDTTLAALRFALARLDIAPELVGAVFPRDGHDAAPLLARLGGARRGRATSAIAHPMVLVDPAMKRLYELIDRIASSELSVLVLGETGAGKEVVARTIHERSPRASQPFLAINCGAFTEEMLESELFGHERGAFTGAVKAKPGLLETAQGGTVFLDELGEMALSTQVKLLRVIEERELRRVGGLKAIPIDVRFVSATNRDLSRAITLGAFREDLYYRLNGVTLQVPPLRERRAEIPALARIFAPEGTLFTDPALAVLESYAWPGNVRELRNVVEHAVVLSGGAPIDISHLPMEKLGSPVMFPSAERQRARGPEETRVHIHDETARPESTLQDELSEMERERILEALESCGGNQSRAAKVLGMSRQALVRRLDQYAVPRPRKGR